MIPFPQFTQNDFFSEGSGGVFVEGETGDDWKFWDGVREGVSVGAGFEGSGGAVVILEEDEEGVWVAMKEELGFGGRDGTEISGEDEDLVGDVIGVTEGSEEEEETLPLGGKEGGCSKIVPEWVLWFNVGKLNKKK